ASVLTSSVLAKEAFWRHLKQESVDVSERQRKMLNRLLEGFAGKLTTEKWANLVKVSHDTALRDIQDLIKKGILRQEDSGGRSTAYTLVYQETPAKAIRPGEDKNPRSVVKKQLDGED